MEEYVVTLHKKEDLEDFYNDMETPGGNLYIPDRAVDCSCRRPISRNTYYMLTEEEASQVLADSRVWNVVKKSVLDDVEIGTDAVQYEPDYVWLKNDAPDVDDAGGTNDQENAGQYGLPEAFWQKENWNAPAKYPNWGDGATYPTLDEKLYIYTTGRNVDILIIDSGYIQRPNGTVHLELNENADGTGASRFQTYNWLQHRNEVNGWFNGVYDYTGSADDHSLLVAASAAGSTQGFAKEANVYGFRAGDSQIAVGEVFDYARIFHRDKSVNPATGVKNPTVVNNSWYLFRNVSISSISSITYLGSTYSGPFTGSTLANTYDCPNNGSTVQAYIPMNDPSYTAFLADYQDAIDEGLIWLKSAGNRKQELWNPGDTGYNNRLNTTGGNYFYSRISIPGADSDASTVKSIVVGALADLSSRLKGPFSNAGPRIDEWVVGHGNPVARYGGVGIRDFRDTRSGIATADQFNISRTSGTSVSCPIVAGIVAAVMEKYPRFTQSDIIEWLEKMRCADGEIGSISGNALFDLNGAKDSKTWYPWLRYWNKGVHPINNRLPRETSGRVYPRPRVRRKENYSV